MLCWANFPPSSLFTPSPPLLYPPPHLHALLPPSFRSLISSTSPFLSPPSSPSMASPSPSQTPPSDPPMATPLSLLVPLQSLPQPQQPQPPLPLPAPPSSRRLPPPCWTPEETSALIDAYKDKWYSLRRGNLRAAHWQEVADDLHRRCPHASLPKTPVQCRHKMEKLRKRYRAELQRAKSIPHHRFSSSWVYFSKMDSMEKGPTSSTTFTNPSPFSPPPPPLATVVAAPLDLSDDDDDDDNDNDDTYDPRRDLYHRNGFKIKIPPNSRNPNPNPNYGGSKFNSRYGSINKFNSSPSPQFEDGIRYATPSATANTRMMGNGSGSRMNMGMGMGMGMGMEEDEVMLMRKKKKRERESSRGGEDNVGSEMVEAIRVLGEGFVRMEKMKMEMMRETERMRMEMEMKRTEMILESQHRIVEAFAKTWAADHKDPSSC